MKKQTKTTKSKRADLLPEYDFRKGTHGKYARRYGEGTNLVLLAPDVAEVFPDSNAVNEALRLIMKVGRQVPKKIGH